MGNAPSQGMSTLSLLSILMLQVLFLVGCLFCALLFFPLERGWGKVGLEVCVRAHSAPLVVYADCSVFVGSKAILVRPVSRHGRDEAGDWLGGCGRIEIDGGIHACGNRSLG